MIAGIVLAAGESKRMGQLKQLLPWGNTFILQQVISTAELSNLDQILVVLGYHAFEISEKLTLSSKTHLVINPDYHEGMSSSVKRGINAAPEDCLAYTLLLGDQPQIKSEVINQLAGCFLARGRGIVIPVYEGKRGHPVIFDARYREELLSVSERGAREIVNKHAPDVLEVKFDNPGVIADIDTPQEYERAIHMSE